MREHLVSILLRGGIAVIPTDTILGVVGRAQSRLATLRLYRLRRKSPRKPFIILIPSVAALRIFGVKPTVREMRFLHTVWPGKVSIIFPVPHKKFSYVHHGTNTLAFRVPRSKVLLSLLKKTGPLLAPSANPEGLPPAKTVREARRYFGKAVDVYAGIRGSVSGRPSTLVSFSGTRLCILRGGAATARTLHRAWTRVS